MNVTGFAARSPLENRTILRDHHIHATRNTVVVQFRFPVRMSDGSPSMRVNTMIVQMDQDATRMAEDDMDRELKQKIQEGLASGALADYPEDENEEINYTIPFGANDANVQIEILSRSVLLTHMALMFQMGLVGSHPSSHGRLLVPMATPMFGYKEDRAPQHRAMRYMIRGCDMKTLQAVIPNDTIHPECDQMCTYHMLEDLNAYESKQTGKTVVPKIFQRQHVNQWMNQHGLAVGGLQDGLSSDDIQAHAIAHRYGHCALDITQSIMNLYIPDERHKHNKTACYYIVGNHCQPVVDKNILNSIMQSGRNRVGTRSITAASVPFSDNTNKQHTTEIRRTQNDAHIAHIRKRRRSLDRVFRPEFEKSEERLTQDTWTIRPTPSDTITDILYQHDLAVEDQEEEFVDPVDLNDENGGKRRNVLQFPLASDTERFHLFTKANDLETVVVEKLKPTYQEGSNPNLVHYYVCTDEDDIEFLYQYMIRVLKVDPLKYARSFHGKCRSIRIHNVWWCANPNIQILLQVHGALHPQEPFLMVGLGTYAFRLLHQQTFQLSRKASTLWECMSHYSPNLQRLLDTNHPFQRAKLMQHVYHPPYSTPQQSTVQTLIPWDQRRRIDLIRSYASVVKNFPLHDEFPIHDPTNRVIPYDEALHGSIPIGHYLVDIPTPEEAATMGTVESWKKMPCLLPLGQPRMMSHRMVRALLERGMIQKERGHIRLACTTDPIRQTRYGRILVEALQNVLQQIYQHEKLQNVSAKHMFNHLIGLCNGTSLPHSGMRYVFHDLAHCYNIIASLCMEDPLKKIKVMHTFGYDTVWHKQFDYYEIDGSGLTYRNFHLQPIFNVILEDQAMHIFDIMRTIPLVNLIQVNIDAIEYRVMNGHDRVTAWCQDLHNNTVAHHEVKACTPAELYNKYMGRYHEETPKGEDKAATYYYEYNTKKNLRLREDKFWYKNDTPMDIVDTEDTVWIKDWHAELRRLPSPTNPTEFQQIVDQLLMDLFVKENQEENHHMERSGFLCTGPAGSGKTQLIRQIQAFATNLGFKVVKTAFTHAACVQMGHDAVTLSSLFGLDEKSDPRGALAMSRKLRSYLRHMEIDVLIIDEISMIPLDLLELLMMFHRVASQTRICCFGDFNQLPPVEPGWERGNDFNYFDFTDIFPFLVYDRVRNLPGQWLPLVEIMRATDPLLVKVAKDPASVGAIQPNDFPMPPRGIPIWRFISWRNTTRKACNFYCMHKYLQMHPTVAKHRFILSDVYAAKRMREQAQRNKRAARMDDATTTATPLPTSAPAQTEESFRQQFLHGKMYRPSHWKYLQSFTYAVGMEVVCRNTLKEWEGQPDQKEKKSERRNEIVNNRRAVIVDINEQHHVTIRWMDVIRKFQESETEEGIDAEDIVLNDYDFAFNFIPGFCITAHMAQGETIREHYAVLEWIEMTNNPRMAYVALTRASAAEFLHIIPNCHSNPWNTDMDTYHEFENILTKLFHAFRWDRNQTYNIDVSDVEQKIKNTTHCALCLTVPLLYTRYNYKSADQFAVMSSDRAESLTPENCILVCNGCRAKDFGRR